MVSKKYGDAALAAREQGASAVVSCDRLPQCQFASALLACNYHRMRFAGQTGDKTACTEHTAELGSYSSAKAYALLNRYEARKKRNAPDSLC